MLFRSASNSVTPASATSYQSIATTTVGAGGQSSVTFSSIPQTYTHLQIRCMLNATSLQGGSATFTINGDSGANYTNHTLNGYYNNGSANVGSFAFTTSSGRNYCQSLVINGFQKPIAIIWDILDYTNTNKYKTIRCFYGTDNNGGNSCEVGLSSSSWLNTNAVNSLSFIVQNGYNIQQYSSLALYGIKGS